MKHPAKFSPQILDVIGNQLVDRIDSDRYILDPFAGIGTIHELPFTTWAVELEPEWADESMYRGLTWQGDWLLFEPGMTFIQRGCWDGHPQTGQLHQADAVATSCTYGNRMADNHTPSPEDTSRRITYRHTLGRPLTENNSGGMQWGDDYRMFHVLSWRKVRNVLAPGGLFILNVKNHVRKGKIMRVAEWHRDFLRNIDFELLKDVKVPVKGMRMGENHELRVNYEHVYVFRKRVKS